MALFTPSVSPAVTVKEIDLTGVVPNVQTSTGAFVGNFGWELLEKLLLSQMSQDWFLVLAHLPMITRLTFTQPHTSSDILILCK